MRFLASHVRCVCNLTHLHKQLQLLFLVINAFVAAYVQLYWNYWHLYSLKFLLNRRSLAWNNLVKPPWKLSHLNHAIHIQCSVQTQISSGLLFTFKLSDLLFWTNTGKVANDAINCERQQLQCGRALRSRWLSHCTSYSKRQGGAYPTGGTLWHNNPLQKRKDPYLKLNQRAYRCHLRWKLKDEPLKCFVFTKEVGFIVHSPPQKQALNRSVLSWPTCAFNQRFPTWLVPLIVGLLSEFRDGNLIT